MQMAYVTGIWKSHPTKYRYKRTSASSRVKNECKVARITKIKANYMCVSIFKAPILIINGIHSNNEYLCVLTVVDYDSYINTLSKLLIRKDISIALEGKWCLLRVFYTIKF